MEIFLPFKHSHHYLNEIIPYSSNSFLFDSYSNFSPSFDIVNIHWPESIFDWREPSIEELQGFEETIGNWKKTAKIVYTKHDYLPTKGTTPNFTKLFKIIEENTDLFIHLGNFSKKFYSEKYPGAAHKVISHPIFSNSFKFFSKSEARKKLGISEGSLVLIAPGKIRHKEEKKLVLKAFEKIRVEDKVLISTNMRNEMEFEFPGRVRFQKVFDVQKFLKEQFIFGHQPPDFLFNYEPISDEEISLRMSAADVVIVPRLNTLNSGIFYLAVSFGKIAVGPSIGNIEEQLVDHKLPVFDPNSITSVVKALEQGIEMYKKGISPKPLEKYLPENVAKEYDLVFKELMNK